MFEGFPRFVHGLACLATLCADPRLALAEGSAEPDTFKRVVDSRSPGALVADEDDEDEDDADDDEELDGPESEREYIARPPAVQRPSVCQQELQAQVRLTGTMYDARHPERSMALMAPGAAPIAVYRSGARLGYLELLEVRPHAVLVTSNAEDSPCWLRLMRPNPNAPPPPAAAPPAEEPKKAKRERKKAFSSEELSAGIQQIGPGIYRVDRTMLDRALARVPAIARSTRTKAVKRNGQTVGVSLRKIEQGGLFEHLGLKKGDVLKTVNGFDMSSVDGMLSAKMQLSNAPRLSVALMRQGVPMTLEYRVQ